MMKSIAFSRLFFLLTFIASFFFGVGSSMAASSAWSDEYLSPSLPPPAVTLRIVGPEETVLSADAPHCKDVDERGERMDVPDAPLRAVRWGGDILALAAHYNNLPYFSRDLKTLERRGCDNMLRSAINPDPAQFSDHEWVVSHYTKGNRLFGLIHNEYWGGLYDDECRKRLGKKVPWASVCLYANLTGAVSNDGRSFDRLGVVAASSYRFASDMNRSGIRDPSNLFMNPKDGHVYMMAIVDGYRKQAGGICLFRTKDPFNEPWYAWDGHGFSYKTGSPYERPPSAKEEFCKPVSGLNITTVVHHKAADVFIALIFDERIKPGGIFYRTSADLINWSRAEFLMEAHDFHFWKKSGAQAPIVYPSLIDPESTSANFDTVHDRPYLYYQRARVRHGQALGRERDIVRRLVSVSMLNKN